MKRCLHNIMGYPRSSKRSWKHIIIKGKDGNPMDWTCTCKEGRKTIKDRTSLTNEEWEKTFKFCGYCGKELVPHKERQYFVTCSLCGEELLV